MTWEKFCELNEIAPKYQNASKEKLRIPNDNKSSYEMKIDIITSQPRSLILSGLGGRGKTYFMFALIKNLFLKKKVTIANIRFFRSILLDDRLVTEFEKFRTTSGFIKDLSDVDFLFIDDFGLERETSKGERDWYDLIDRRTSFEKITVYSTNLSEDSLKKLYGERIHSRLKECAWIDFKGPDLRESIRI